MGIMLRLNGYEVGFEIMEKNINLLDICSLENGIIIRVGRKGY